MSTVSAASPSSRPATAASSSLNVRKSFGICSELTVPMGYDVTTVMATHKADGTLTSTATDNTNSKNALTNTAAMGAGGATSDSDSASVAAVVVGLVAPAFVAEHAAQSAQQSARTYRVEHVNVVGRHALESSESVARRVLEDEHNDQYHALRVRVYELCGGDAIAKAEVGEAALKEQRMLNTMAAISGGFTSTMALSSSTAAANNHMHDTINNTKINSSSYIMQRPPSSSYSSSSPPLSSARQRNNYSNNTTSCTVPSASSPNRPMTASTKARMAEAAAATSHQHQHQQHQQSSALTAAASGAGGGVQLPALSLRQLFGGSTLSTSVPTQQHEQQLVDASMGFGGTSAESWSRGNFAPHLPSLTPAGERPPSAVVAAYNQHRTRLSSSVVGGATPVHIPLTNEGSVASSENTNADAVTITHHTPMPPRRPISAAVVSALADSDSPSQPQPQHHHQITHGIPLSPRTGRPTSSSLSYPRSPRMDHHIHTYRSSTNNTATSAAAMLTNGAATTASSSSSSSSTIPRPPPSAFSVNSVFASAPTTSQQIRAERLKAQLANLVTERDAARHQLEVDHYAREEAAERDYYRAYYAQERQRVKEEAAAREAAVLNRRSELGSMSGAKAFVAGQEHRERDELVAEYEHVIVPFLWELKTRVMEEGRQAEHDAFLNTDEQRELVAQRLRDEKAAQNAEAKRKAAFLKEQQRLVNDCKHSRSHQSVFVGSLAKKMCLMCKVKYDDKLGIYVKMR